MKIYLKLDVLLLCDIWIHFNKLCLKHYGLCPGNYLTLPGLSYDAALKK